MKQAISIVIGGLTIATIGHYVGPNIALAVVGGWVFAIGVKV